MSNLERQAHKNPCKKCEKKQRDGQVFFVIQLCYRYFVDVMKHDFRFGVCADKITIHQFEFHSWF